MLNETVSYHIAHLSTHHILHSLWLLKLCLAFEPLHIVCILFILCTRTSDHFYIAKSKRKKNVKLTFWTDKIDWKAIINATCFREGLRRGNVKITPLQTIFFFQHWGLFLHKILFESSIISGSKIFWLHRFRKHSSIVENLLCSMLLIIIPTSLIKLYLSIPFVWIA